MTARAAFLLTLSIVAGSCSEDYRRTQPDIGLDSRSRMHEIRHEHDTGWYDTGGEE